MSRTRRPVFMASKLVQDGVCSHPAIPYSPLRVSFWENRLREPRSGALRVTSEALAKRMGGGVSGVEALAAVAKDLERTMQRIPTAWEVLLAVKVMLSSPF